MFKNKGTLPVKKKHHNLTILQIQEITVQNYTQSIITRTHAHTHVRTHTPEQGGQTERQQRAAGWGGTSDYINSYGLFSLGSGQTQPSSAGVWILLFFW